MASMQHDLAPRLWGQWCARVFQSGTTIVCQKDTLRKPWLYVYADSSIDEDRWMADRVRMCRELQRFLNGGDRPIWLDDFERVSERKAMSLSGGRIKAVGPMVARGRSGIWDEDQSARAARDRTELMDTLLEEE